MKFLLASSPLVGHVNPVVTVARILKQAGHEASIYTGRFFQEKIESAGLRFYPLPEDVDHDMRDVDALFPERSQHEPGPAENGFRLKESFCRRYGISVQRARGYPARLSG